MNLFSRKARAIETSIDKYLDNITKAALTFELGLKEYYKGMNDRFQVRCEEIRLLESESDNIRRDIKVTLYKELLIPDARGDVLGLLETLDNVIDVAEKVMLQFDIEKPVVWPQLKEDFIELTESSVKCVLELIAASRAFFREISHVADFNVKVHYWEREADKTEERIKRKAFEADFIEKFSMKVHVRYFAERISWLADEAEAVAERLEVYSIKRTI